MENIIQKIMQPIFGNYVNQNKNGKWDEKLSKYQVNTYFGRLKMLLQMCTKGQSRTTSIKNEGQYIVLIIGLSISIVK